MMPTSKAISPVSRHNGQIRINLRVALETQHYKTSSVQMTFGELARAYLATHYNGADMQLRKWIDLLETRSAWEVGADELALSGIAMIENGYSPSTVNRNMSQIGSVYRWARQRLLTPVGFVSPTISQHRYPESMRRVFISDQEVQKLIDGAAGEKDRRFQVLIRLLAETGARKSEVTERRWKDVDLDACSIEVMDTKTGKPRMMFFSQATHELIRRVWPQRPINQLMFESRKVKEAVTNFTKPWNKLRQSIGRGDFNLNDLRHHRAKLLLESGSTLAVASQTIGNSSLILYRRYGHLESHTIEKAVKASWR
jgi:integrase